jgi:hypothetical protein
VKEVKKGSSVPGEPESTPKVVVLPLGRFHALGLRRPLSSLPVFGYDLTWVKEGILVSEQASRLGDGGALGT